MVYACHNIERFDEFTCKHVKVDFCQTMDISDTLIMLLINISHVDKLKPVRADIEKSAESIWVNFQLLPG